MTALDLTLPGPLPAVGFRTWSRTRLAALTARLLAVREVGLLTLLALILYVAVGFWARFDLHFFINDALNRTSDALYVTYSRDPHLAAIGFFWPPLPQLIQIPIMAVVEPLGLTVMAGPISSAFCVALTIPVLARIGRFLGLGRAATFLFLLAFAFNPISVYYAANGMSEACFFLTGSISLYGFLRYIRHHEVRDMWVFSWGLAGCVLTRLEGPLFALVLAVIAAFSWHIFVSRAALVQAVWTTFLIGLPALASFGVWMAIQWVIMGDPLFFLHGGAGAGVVGGGAAGAAAATGAVQRPGLPLLSKEPWASYPWAAYHVVVFGTVLILVAATILLGPWSARTRGSIGIVAAMCVFMVFQIESIGYARTGYGNPRYFVVAVPFSVIGAMWLASSQRTVWAGLWNLGLLGVLAANWYTGTRYESNGYVTQVEHECAFFQYGVARLFPSWGTGGTPGSKDYCLPFPDAMKAYQEADDYLDKVMKRSDRVFTDNSSVFEADLFTTHPNQFIIRNDRDFQRIADNPVSDITYIVTHGTSATSPPLQDVGSLNVGGVDVGEQIISNDPQAWTLVKAWESTPGIWVQLYHINEAVVNSSQASVSGS